MLQEQETSAQTAIEMHMLKSELEDCKRQRDAARAQVSILKSIIEKALESKEGGSYA